MKEENDLDHYVQCDAVEKPVDCVSMDELMLPLNGLKTGKYLDIQMCHWS